MNTANRPFVLFYDGTCGLCRCAAAFIRWLGPRAPVRLVDAADPRQLAPFPQVSPYQAMQSVHLLTPTGRLHRGYDAVVALTRLLPGFRWLAPLMGTRIARRVGSFLYEWVTAHRHRISYALGLG